MREGREERLFDSASTGDMAFLLLIFFIVTSSFILRQGIFFSLPSPSAGSVKVQEHELVEIFPENDGYLFRGEKLDRTELVNRLRTQKELHSGSVLVIRMAEKVRFEMLVDALSIAKETGFRDRVSLKEAGGSI